MVLIVLLACQPAPDAPDPIPGCDSLSGETLDRCLVDLGVKTAKSDVDAGVALIEQVSDPLLKDYGWYSLTRDVDPTSNRWCEKIESQKLGERCRVFVSRPHMHQHLIDGNRAL